jgi:methyl-accepting chemotaxis protein
MHALREMQDSMRDIVTQVRQASHHIVQGSTTISEDASQLAQHSEASGVALERTTQSMLRIGATVRNTAQRADEATTIGRENVEAAERGGRVIEDVFTTMREIHDASNRIGEIIGVIDGIAFQTNILALNAAVEAARAGEAGRGFAVVASEVRSLAQRSADAAREVKTLVGTSVDKVENGVRVVKQAGTVIEEIVCASQKVNALIEDIAGSAREQAEGVEATSRDVLEVDALINNNSAMVQDAANAAGVLREQAPVLAENVARFRLAEQRD